MTKAFAARTSQSWWFADQCLTDIQAIVGTGFGRLPWGLALLLSVPASGGGWLASLDVTTAHERRDGQTHAITLALTFEGLRRCGLPETVLDRFPTPFREGMTQADRARRLGDAPTTPEEPGTLVEGGLLWSGATPAAAPPQAPDYAQAHALLLLYAATPQGLETERRALGDTLAAAGVAIVREIALTPAYSSDEAAPREQFGFVDGLSQPFPEDAPDTPEGDRVIVPKREEAGAAIDAALAYHRIRTGDILFGRKDAYGERPGGIFIDAAVGEGLPQGAAPPGQRDFSWNGTFLVARELTQDVARFWDSVGRVAEAQSLPATTVAEKMVGRSIDGDLLRPDGPGTDNDTGFAADDPHGFGCPLGSHSRRSNPRDTGARDADEAVTRRGSTNNHRIMRRGRNFGPAAFAGTQGAVGRPPEGAPGTGVIEPEARRGLLFMCLNTDIIRQFEFIQQTWLMNRQFGGLHQSDPIVGPAGLFSIPQAPVRRRVAVETFVRLAGGEYFFLPSQAALAWLSKRSAGRPASGAATVAND